MNHAVILEELRRQRQREMEEDAARPRIHLPIPEYEYHEKRELDTTDESEERGICIIQIIQ